jgi:hypothetical protein
MIQAQRRRVQPSMHGGSDGTAVARMFGSGRDLRSLPVLAVLLGCTGPATKPPQACVGHVCPAGTECGIFHAPPPAAESLACDLEPTPTASALTEGFGVQSLLLDERVTEEGAVIFDWEIPPGALAVQCTLFGCAPLFAYDRPSADDEPRAYIANFARCQLATKTFSAASGPLVLRELTAASRANGPALNTSLDLGCWALDQVQVIAASLLVPVDPRELAAGAFPIVATCPDAATRASCLIREPSGFRTFGTCVAGECRHRCFENRDCLNTQLRERQRAMQLNGASNDASVDAEPPDAGAPDASTPLHCDAPDPTRTVLAGTCVAP